MEPFTQEEMLRREGNIFVRVFNGDISLPVTYWVWGSLIGGIGFGLANVFIEGNLFRVSMHRYGLTLVYGFYWIWFAYWVFASIAIWRSAGNYQGWSVWAAAARLMVVIGALSAIGQILITLEEDEYSSQALAEQAALLNSSLPTMIDESTRLDSVNLTPSEFSYHLTVTNAVVAETNTELFKLQMEVSLTNDLCGDEQSRAELESGISYRYRYRDAVGEIISDVLISLDDCG